MLNYATKFGLKNATDVNRSQFAWKNNLAKLGGEVDKLGKVPSSLNSLKSKVHKLVVDKLKPLPVDLKN